jgi:hypothetical protein
MSLKSNTTFRLQAKNIFVTYSQCPLSASTVITAIKAIFTRKLSYVIAGQELHEEEGKHLHVLIVLKSRPNIRNPRYLDLGMDGKPEVLKKKKKRSPIQPTKQAKVYHPKMEAARSVNDSICYVTKEGKAQSWGINWKEARKQALKRKSVKSVVIAEDLLTGSSSMMDIIQMYPGFSMMHLKKIQDFQLFIQLQQLQNLALPHFPGLKTGIQFSRAHNRIFKWINKNFYGLPTRPHKQKQLFIHGPPNTGKTSLISFLQTYFKAYELPRANGFYDLYNDSYDFVYIDEFQAFVTTYFLNQFLEGRPMQLNRKGLPPVIKKKNMPVIILSNKTLENCFPNTESYILSTLQCRLKQVELVAGDMIIPELLPEEMPSDEDTLSICTSDDELDQEKWEAADCTLEEGSEMDFF